MNMDNIFNLIEDWRNHKIMDDKPFINFLYAKPSVLKVRVLAFPSLALGRPEPIIDENV